MKTFLLAFATIVLSANVYAAEEFGTLKVVGNTYLKTADASHYFILISQDQSGMLSGFEVQCGPSSLFAGGNKTLHIHVKYSSSLQDQFLKGQYNSSEECERALWILRESTLKAPSFVTYNKITNQMSRIDSN